MVLIDRCGRRRLLLLSLTGVVVALTLLTVAFHLTAHDSPAINFSLDNTYAPFTCDSKTALLPSNHCTQCLSAGCGFCAARGDEVNTITITPSDATIPYPSNRHSLKLLRLNLMLDFIFIIDFFIKCYICIRFFALEWGSYLRFKDNSLERMNCLKIVAEIFEKAPH